MVIHRFNNFTRFPSIEDHAAVFDGIRESTKYESENTALALSPEHPPRLSRQAENDPKNTDSSGKTALNSSIL
jgi:hypothetical protein